jgi:hypothetical protein
MHVVRTIIGVGLAAAVAFGLAAVSVVRAQDQARAKVVGVWEGTINFGSWAPAVMQFTADGETIRWKCSFRTASNILWGDAEGTVTSFSDPNLEASGVYTKHSVAGIEGTPVKFSLALQGDQIKGTATHQMTNVPAAVSLTRKK